MIEFLVDEALGMPTVKFNLKALLPFYCSDCGKFRLGVKPRTYPAAYSHTLGKVRVCQTCAEVAWVRIHAAWDEYHRERHQRTNEHYKYLSNTDALFSRGV